VPPIEPVVCSIATTYARSPLTSAERISHPADSKPVYREATQSKVAWVRAGPVADVAAPNTVTGSRADHSALRGPASPECRASSAAFIRATSASMSSALSSTMCPLSAEIDQQSIGIDQWYNTRVAPVNPRRSYGSTIRRGDAPAAILAAAAKLFRTKGYLAASIDDIAAEAGVARPPVFAAGGPKPPLLKLVVGYPAPRGDARLPVAGRTGSRGAAGAEDPATSPRRPPGHSRRILGAGGRPALGGGIRRRGRRRSRRALGRSPGAAAHLHAHLCPGPGPQDRAARGRRHDHRHHVGHDPRPLPPPRPRRRLAAGPIRDLARRDIHPALAALDVSSPREENRAAASRRDRSGDPAPRGLDPGLATGSRA